MNKHIQRAIKAVKGQNNLAVKLGYTQPFISLMLNDEKEIPAVACRKIEFLTDGESTAEQILPDVFLKVTSL